MSRKQRTDALKVIEDALSVLLAVCGVKWEVYGGMGRLWWGGQALADARTPKFNFCDFE